MIAFLSLCYCGLLWLIFFKLKLLPWTRGSQIASAGIGIAAILVLVFSMNIFQPFSQDVRVYQRVIQIVPRVTGRVTEVAVRSHEVVKEKDVLFRIDPEPYQFNVDRLEADLELKAIVLSDAKTLTGARVAAEIQLERAQSGHDQTLAQLNDAKKDLRETTVYAPTDGIVSNLALSPGQIASKLASMPVMTFIDTNSRVVVATFSQSALDFVQVGDAVEIAFDRFPGRIVSGRVDAFVPATGQGQLPPSGTLLEWTTAPVPGRFAVILELDGADELTIPGGAAGAAAVYTDRAAAIRIVRKVVVRMTTWLNYLGL
jgi:multidrug resistance efflux pump